MKDFNKNELSVGDEVIFIEPGYRNFVKGVIYKITDKFVFINWQRSLTLADTIKQQGYQLIKVQKPVDNE